MKTLSNLQELTFEFEEIIQIEDIGYQECIDIEVDDDHSFCLSNGIISHNSASSSLISALGRNCIGYFASRGVPLNAYVANITRFTANKELTNLVKILGMSLKKDANQYLTYKNIVLANDADCLYENTEIVTDNGPKRIKDINYGDKILTYNGEYKPVVNIVSKNTKEYVKLSVNGENIYMTLLHQIPVFRANKLINVFAKDILVTDKILIKK